MPLISKVRKLLVAALLTIACACTPMASPQQALARTNQEFAGQDISAFTISYGAPTGVISNDGTGKVYRWLSIEPNTDHSAYLARTGNYTIPDMSSEGIGTSGYCEVRIRTDRQDRIRKITLVQDSIGKFSGSRCGEIFGESAPTLPPQ